MAFPPNYNVTLAELIIPAADLSEQISLAGKEASGTGNMKLALNGAVTIGTLDGANVEIRDRVGADNFFLFGLDAPQALDLRHGDYRPLSYYERDAELRDAIDAIRSGVFGAVGGGVVDSLLGRDEYLTLADYRAYVDRQDDVDEAWLRHRPLDPDVDAEHRPLRLLLLRPHGARLPGRGSGTSTRYGCADHLPGRVLPYYLRRPPAQAGAGSRPGTGLLTCWKMTELRKPVTSRRLLSRSSRKPCSASRSGTPTCSRKSSPPASTNTCSTSGIFAADALNVSITARLNGRTCTETIA